MSCCSSHFCRVHQYPRSITGNSYHRQRNDTNPIFGTPHLTYTRFDDLGAQIFMENLESENSITELEKEFLKRLKTDTIVYKAYCLGKQVGREILLKELESN